MDITTYQSLSVRQIFFTKVLIRAFGIVAEAAAVKAMVEADNDGEIPKGVIIDKEV